MTHFILYYLLAVCLFGMLICLIDKKRAKKGAWRISERTFFITALLGGGFGIWCGMYMFRHKTKHWYFVWGIPAITIVECGLFIWAVVYFYR